ncbi:alpha/beta hydrolase [Methylocystis sp. H62]|uniref:alpha/beta hydrolase n=1 Tax=Methylocystis sp. H62 TaxID=2785789 RepID=UPI0018C2CCEB|nr:alpha/beta hydrolase [Methylocystis sp. H62]MBG0793323.1 alpha/beta hydrolase [Methylocystis sp. H62]
MGEIENRGDAPADFVDARADGPGVIRISDDDPAAPFYRLLSKLRAPVAMRDMMMAPVRACYRGEGLAIDPAELPPGAAQLYPQVSVSTLAVPSDAGPIRCECYAPPGDGPKPLMLYVHGGGFVVGRSEDTAYVTSRIATENNIIVVSVNYRWAPEWPFPAGLDDCMAVLRWMRDTGADIGGDASRILVCGDSAGGNLAAALPLRGREERISILAAVLLCPVTDFHFENYASYERLAPTGVVIDAAFMGFARGAYLTKSQQWRDPWASPALGDLNGYPRTLLISGTADPLVDDNRAFAEKLTAAGVEVTHFFGEAMPHGFYFFPGVLKESDAAFAAIRRFVPTALQS